MRSCHEKSGVPSRKSGAGFKIAEAIVEALTSNKTLSAVPATETATRTFAPRIFSSKATGKYAPTPEHKDSIHTSDKNKPSLGVQLTKAKVTKYMSSQETPKTKVAKQVLSEFDPIYAQPLIAAKLR